MKNSALACLLVLLWASPAFAVDRYVCAAGDGTCGGTPAYTTIALALTASSCGDTIKLKSDETFTAAVVLPNKGDCSASRIVITSTASAGNLASTGYRVSPTLHASAMPNLQSTGGNAPAITTAAGANGYTLTHLEILPNPSGFNYGILLGSADTDQQKDADQPRNITLDRIIVKGDPVVGQKGGVQLNGRNLAVTNSHISEIWGVGQDAVGIAILNGHCQPCTITNTYLEGAGYNFIIGGLDPQMFTFAEVASSPTPSVTGATLQNFRSNHTIATLSVGQLIAIKTTNNTVRRHTIVRSINGNAITFDAIPEAPSSGAGSEAEWGVIPDQVTFRRNHVAKPAAWMDPILATPQGVTVTATVGGGGNTLAAGTYCYRVVARNANGYQGNSHFSAASAETCQTLTATGKQTIAWTAVPNATHYRVFGRVSGTISGYVETASTSADDTGAALTAGSLPTATVRTVKNLFELKFGTNVQIDSNIFEYSWPGADNGSAIWIKANNQDGNCAYCQTKNVTLEKAIIRHVPGFFSLLGRFGQGGAINNPPPLENITIRHVLGYDSNASWTQGRGSIWGIKVLEKQVNLRIEHTTLLHHVHGYLYLDGSPGLGNQVEGFTFLNNLGRAETYGVFGVNCSQGSACLTTGTLNGAFTFDGNAVAGKSGTYPALANDYPTVTDFETNHFTNYAGGVNGDYSLVAGSTFNDGGTDGTDQGADVAAVLAAVNGVVEGNPEGVAFTPITITTTSIAQGTNGVAYSAQLSATTTTGPYTWAVTSGSLPGWASLNSSTGAITGTPNAVAATTFTVQVTDSQGTPQTDTQQLTLTVIAAPVALSVSTTTLDHGIQGSAYSKTLSATGGTSPYTWSVSSGTLPAGVTLSSAGELTGVPTARETRTVTVQATDAMGTSTTRQLTLTVDAEARPCNRPARVGFSEAFLFRGTTAPGLQQCVVTGDLWVDTSTTPPTLKRSTVTASAVSWEALGGGTSHNLLSTSHGDTTAGTPTDGCIIVGTGGGGWTMLCPGASGTYLQSTGSGVAWRTAASANTEINASNITSGTLASARGGNGVKTIPLASGTVLTTDPPVGGRELGAPDGTTWRGFRIRVDTENATQIALFAHVSVACAAGVMRIEYWTGSAWAETTSQSECTATGLKEGAFVTLPVAARAQNTIFRLWFTSGDGSVDPVVTTVQAQFR